MCCVFVYAYAGDSQYTRPPGVHVQQRERERFSVEKENNFALCCNEFIRHVNPHKEEKYLYFYVMFSSQSTTNTQIKHTNEVVVVANGGVYLKLLISTIHRPFLPHFVLWLCKFWTNKTPQQ